MVWNRYFWDPSHLVLSESYWQGWAIGGISQERDNYHSWENDIQNSGQTKSNCNLLPFFWTVMVEVLQILIKNSVWWNIRWGKSTAFSAREACYYFVIPSDLEVSVIFEIKSIQS